PLLITSRFRLPITPTETVPRLVKMEPAPVTITSLSLPPPPPPEPMATVPLIIRPPLVSTTRFPPDVEPTKRLPKLLQSEPGPVITASLLVLEGFPPTKAPTECTTAPLLT